MFIRSWTVQESWTGIYCPMPVSIQEVGGMSKAARWRFNTKQRRCPFRGEANELRNFAARGCWAWGRITAFKKQLRRLMKENFIIVYKPKKMLTFPGLGKAWVVTGGMRENRPGRHLLLSPAWSPRTFGVIPHNLREACEGSKSWNNTCARRS